MMRLHRTAIVTLLLVSGLPTRVLAEATADDAKRALSYEVRAEVFSPSYRWSNVDHTVYSTEAARRSLYFSSGLGLRIVSQKGHAGLIDGDYRFDGDFDGIADEDSFPIRFGVVHAGYAYRYAPNLRNRLDRRRVWTISPHVAMAAGVARRLAYATAEDIPKRSPVFGARVGVDFDLHINGRFFFEWRLSYEILHHTEGSLTRSNFFAWNVIPVFRMGVNFGRRAK